MFEDEVITTMHLFKALAHSTYDTVLSVDSSLMDFQCCYSVTSRTVGTVGLLSRFSVLQFAARCCTCPAVTWYPDSGFKLCSHPCTQAKLHLNVRCKELASRLLSDLLHT